MEFKQHSTEIKAFDEKEGIVEAYANVYLNEDSDGDISAPGSFTKTVSENFKRIRVLKDHDRRVSLGVPVKIDSSDSYGLKTITQFNLNKEVSRDMFSDILLAKKHGLNAELSIGFGEVKRDQKDSRIIKEYGWLGEYSFLSSWAANELAVVGDVKELSKPGKYIDLLVKAYDLPYSDQRLIEIEKLLKSLTMEPSQSATPGNEPIDTKSIINHIQKSFS